jgi:hypothetical protein
MPPSLCPLLVRFSCAPLSLRSSFWLPSLFSRLCSPLSMLFFLCFPRCALLCALLSLRFSFFLEHLFYFIDAPFFVLPFLCALCTLPPSHLPCDPLASCLLLCPSLRVPLWPSFMCFIGCFVREYFSRSLTNRQPLLSVVFVYALLPTLLLP